MLTRLLATVLLCLVGAASAFAQAQAGTASIVGTVQDASGASVPNATVTIANEAKGIRRNLTTNQDGIFNAPSLPPATGYSVTVQAPGFAEYTRKDMELLIGQQLNLTIPVNVAAAAQTVEVTAGAPIVETTRTGVSQVVNENQIMNLPINGRRVDSFVLLTPTTTTDGSFGLVSFRGVAGHNAFLTDGNDTTNQFYNENAGRTRISAQISQDAVQEFQVLSNGYSAEFGRAMGGVVNTLTRSGSNEVHGTGYWFFRNHSLNARDRYSAITFPGGVRQNFKAKESRHQFGGSIGGPIVKDKLFYFFNTELTRRNFPLVNALINPNIFDSSGRIRERQNNGQRLCGDPVARPRPATPQECAAALGFLDRQFQTLPRTADSELAFGKLDYRPTDRHSLSASFNYLRWISPNGIQTQSVLTNGNGIGNNADSTVRTRYGRASWTVVPGSTVVNEFRFGWFKDRLFDDFNPALVPAQTGRIGLTVFGQSNLGVAVDYPRLNPSENRYQVVDNLSWTTGKHSLKFGVDIMSTRDYLNLLRNQYGSYNYNDFNSFAVDFSGNGNGKNWQSFTQTFGNPILDFTIRDYAFYVQDQYRATRGLTLNYGLRYEYADLPTPPLPHPAYAQQTGRLNQPSKNFSPRLGFAYAFNNDKTVLRGGYGIFFARFPGGMIETLFTNNGLYRPQLTFNASNASELAAGPVFPNRLAPSSVEGRTPPAGTVDITWADENFRNPYTQQMDFGIEHQLTTNIGVTLSYVRSRGIGLFTTRDMNVGPLGPDVTYRINDASGNQVGSYTTPTYRLANRVDPRFRRLVQVENGGRSYYDAMVLQVRKRFSHGFEGSVAYTWSHAIDTANQGGGTNAIFFGALRSTFNGDYNADKGSSQLDQRHRVGISSIWRPTITRSNSAWARYFVNGWQLAQMTLLATPQPATTTMRVVGRPFPGAAFNTSLNGLGGSNRVPFLPFSNLDIDNVHRVDARLTKILPFTERVQLHLNFEAFNVFNTISNTFVFTEAYSAQNGVLTPTPRLGEGSASQGFPDGTNARRAQVSARFIF